MRKALLGILMAATAATGMPAMAQNTSQMPERYQRQAERNQARVERRMERQQAPQRIERQERRQERREDRARIAPQRSSIEQRRNRQFQTQQQAVAERQRRDRGAGAQRVYPADMPESYRRQWDRNAARVQQERRDDRLERREDRRDRRADRRDHRRDYRADRRDWRQSWRQDRRYDWQRYRYANRNLYRPGIYYSPYRNHRYSRFSVGLFLDQGFYSSRYWISEPWHYRLPQAYPGTQWVRYYDDVLLVDLYSGEVIDVIYDFFW